MRSVWIILVIGMLTGVAAGCGQEQPDYTNYYVNLAANKIAWSGSVSADPKLKADFDATIQCVKDLEPDAIKTTAYPNVVVIDQPDFTCWGIPNTKACTGWATSTIYIDQADEYTYVFTHEAVHWITQTGNEAHFKSYYSCTYMVDTFYQAAVQFVL